MKRLSRKRNLRRHQSAMRTQIVLLLSLALGFLIVLRIAQQPRKWNGAVESIAEGERTAGDYRENRLGKVGIRDESEVRVPTFEECPRRRASLEGEESDEAILVHRAAPGSMRYNHMAMIDKLDNGSLVLVWQFSSGIEGVADQGLALSLSSDASGRSWSRPRVIPIQREAEKGALWSPVLHSQPGKLMLLYAESTDCVIHKGGVMRYSPGGSIKLVEWAYSDSSPSSFDWSEPRQVYAQSDGDQIPKVLANKLIVLKSGELVLPMWSEKHGSCQRHKSKGSAGVLVSEDKGKTWEKRGTVAAADTWLIENTVVETKGGGSILMLFRTKKGYIYKSTSTDKGYTWSKPRKTQQMNPDAKIHALRLSNTTLALAYNDHKKFQKPGLRGCRTNLDVTLSEDDGRTWSRALRAERETDAGLRTHYPTLFYSGCKIFLAYTKFYHESVQEKSKWELFGTKNQKNAPVLGVFVRVLDYS